MLYVYWGGVPLKMRRLLNDSTIDGCGLDRCFDHSSHLDYHIKDARGRGGGI